jgi:hypothetical protein
MNNTLKISDTLEVRIGQFIQIPVPYIFESCQTEEEIDSFSSCYSALLKKDFNVEDILIVKGANNIQGKDIVACLMELGWTDPSAAFKTYTMNLIWFQEGFAFPINQEIEQVIRNLQFDLVGREEPTPF